MDDKKVVWDWVHSYDKDTDTFRVLLTKIPNILKIIEKARQDEREKVIRIVMESDLCNRCYEVLDYELDKLIGGERKC